MTVVNTRRKSVWGPGAVLWEGWAGHCQSVPGGRQGEAGPGNVMQSAAETGHWE